jgi:hypothetical protein
MSKLCKSTSRCIGCCIARRSSCIQMIVKCTQDRSWPESATLVGPRVFSKSRDMGCVTTIACVQKKKTPTSSTWLCMYIRDLPESTSCHRQMCRSKRQVRSARSWIGLGNAPIKTNLALVSSTAAATPRLRENDPLQIVPKDKQRFHTLFHGEVQ